MSEAEGEYIVGQEVLWDVDTTLSPNQASAIIASTDREYWRRKHRELVTLDDFLCKTYGFSRSGIVKGETVSVKTLRGIVDK